MKCFVCRRCGNSNINIYMNWIFCPLLLACVFRSVKHLEVKTSHAWKQWHCQELAVQRLNLRWERVVWGDFHYIPRQGEYLCENCDWKETISEKKLIFHSNYEYVKLFKALDKWEQISFISCKKVDMSMIGRNSDSRLSPLG